LDKSQPCLFGNFILQLLYRYKKSKIMLQAKLSSKFQLSIPKALREDLRLEAGQQFTLVARGNIIELIPSQSIKDARGMLSPATYNNSFDYRDRQARDKLTED
jgi:AbrB family looped-hinge helix DNA binding protein